MESFFLNVKKALNHRSLVLENRRYQERSINVLKAMITTLEHRDTYTAGHSRRVTEIAVSIAEKMSMEPCDIKRVRLASTVHDIGKVGIPDAILRKPGPLTTEEYEVVKLHPEKGRSIIEPLGFLKESLPCILHHHEKFDGSGYPTGLSGYEIPLGSRIIAVADTVDAITSSRAYRDARAMEKALDELKKFSKIQFDPEIVEVFVSLQDE
jgi:HD-GYP domain-containing protein (c-di-GMP phosphodiesterase class II)